MGTFVHLLGPLNDHSTRLLDGLLSTGGHFLPYGNLGFQEGLKFGAFSNQKHRKKHEKTSKKKNLNCPEKPVHVSLREAKGLVMSVISYWYIYIYISVI